MHLTLNVYALKKNLKFAKTPRLTLILHAFHTGTDFVLISLQTEK